MLFNSLEFIVFFVAVFLIYWKLSKKYQNWLLVLASFFFYSWWDWRFLLLIIITSLVGFLSSRAIEKTEKIGQRKLYLSLGVAGILMVLGLFKYFGFFVESLQSLLISLGIAQASLTTLRFILPLGISFYTFKTVGYLIEVYQRKVAATGDFIQFMAFVSFFPQLLAGPIERAATFLVQFAQERVFQLSEATDGLKQMLWGFFKKIVVADTLAQVVNNVYGNVYDFSGSQLFFATFFFAFQLYCDFSGYSDIAIGSGKLFGLKTRRNFALPYFSRSIQEFWQRWHISMSTWFKDYLFVPLAALGGTWVKSKYEYARNTLLTFTVIGLWHGANWTYVFFGLLHGIYLIPQIYLKRSPNEEKTVSLKQLPQILFVFVLVLLSWVFFRASSMSEAFYVLEKIFLHFGSFDLFYPKRLALVLCLVGVEWIQRKEEHPLILTRFGLPRWARWLIYWLIIALIFLIGVFEYIPFIYFKF